MHERNVPHERLRLRPVCHWRRIRRGAGGAACRRSRQEGGHRRGIPVRRNLRHSWLRAEETVRLCLAVCRAFRGCARLWLDGRRKFVRLADADRQQGPGDRAAGRALPARAGKCRGRDHFLACRTHRPQFGADQVDRADRDGRTHPHCRRRQAQSACLASRPRALHQFQRGLPSEGTAQGHPDRRRRLYRGRVRQHLPRARRRDHADLPRQGDPVALRPGHAPGPAQGDGGKGHPHPLPRGLRKDRARAGRAAAGPHLGRQVGSLR